MAIDFVRTSSSKITCTSSPLSARPIMMECWCTLHGWEGEGFTYGALMGIYGSIGGYKMMLRIRRDATGFPITHRAEFVIVNASGTFIAYSGTVSANTWLHILGYWRSTSPYTIAILVNGAAGTGTSSSGLFLPGTPAYDFGWDANAAGDYFDGLICEWVVWDCNITGGAGSKPATIAYHGLKPIYRHPFYHSAGPTLRSWVPGHNTSVYDVMRPGVSYTETNVNTAEDHAPIFGPRRLISHPRPTLVVTALQRCGIPMMPHMIVG